MLNYETALSILRAFNLNEGDYNNEQKALSLKFGGEPSVYDVTWSHLNKLIAGTSDIWKLRNIYNQMAIVCDLVGQEPFEFIYKANEMQLKQLLELGIYPKVKIMCLMVDCKEGKRLNNKKFKHEEALALMPIPSKNCNHKASGKYNYCMCDYIPLSKGEK